MWVITRVENCSKYEGTDVNFQMIKQKGGVLFHTDFYLYNTFFSIYTILLKTHFYVYEI